MVEGDSSWYDPVAPDPPYWYGGRPLADWLIDLVSDDYGTRRPAGNAVVAIAQPYRSLNPTTPEQLEEFKRLLAESEAFGDVVRRIIETPGFPKAWFVRALCEYRVALQESWERRVDRQVSREERAADRVVERYKANPSAPGADEIFGRRLARIYLGSRDADHEVSTNAHTAAWLVFGALDSALLADPDALILVLRQNVLADSAAKAIARVGPAGRGPFAAVLLAELDATSEARAFRFAEALASVVRDDPELIQGLIGRALNEQWSVAAGAIEVLSELGPAVLKLDPDLLWKLRQRDVPEPAFPIVLSLGRIGRDDPRLLTEILALAKPRPPVLRNVGGYEWDVTRSERAAALESLANFTGFPDQVVPVLVNALGTFEEYDPDWGYHLGAHGRVIASLRAFGPAAAPAAPALAVRLKEPTGEVDWEVIRFLGELGPLAVEALTALERLRAELYDGQDAPTPQDNSTDAPDKASDPLEWAIWRLRGNGSGGTST